MWRFGLRGKMAASYVLVTATAVFLVEAVIAAIYLIPWANATDLAAVLQEQAANDTTVLNLEVARISTTRPGLSPAEVLAAVAAGTRDSKVADDARRRAVPGEVQPRALPSEVQPRPVPGDDPPQAVPSAPPPRTDVPPRTLVGGAEPLHKQGLAMLAALVDMSGAVVESSAPAIYPVGGTLDVSPPGLRGGPGVGSTRTGPTTWHFSPVLIKSPDGSAGFDAIGYVYVQAPSDAAPTPTVGELLPLVAAGGLALALVVPVGLVFGLLSTRRLTSRVRRLAGVTTAVAAGDFRPRVPVAGSDEVSTLERSVNLMADRLGAAVEADRATARAEARQAERGRIARELHDSISQDLFSLSLLAAGMRRAAPGGLREQSEAMERTAARAMREMQALLLELRPVALEDAGLLPALRELCHAYEERLGVAVEAELDEVTLPPAAEHAVLRLVQEAVGNAVKHANPSRIEVRLRERDGAITVSVSDDGTGFDPADVATRHGMGLKLMRERVTELGGRLDLHSDESGTTVTARLT
ncbi:ATP-binding protein [Nonomuraea sp. KM90]|uniref:ATP-binding protein n=1 Tax=Nonomuraea sp. KM90 TaxID=3457428 RepID=UPI003FCE5967